MLDSSSAAVEQHSAMAMVDGALAPKGASSTSIRSDLALNIAYHQCSSSHARVISSRPSFNSSALSRVRYSTLTKLDTFSNVMVVPLVPNSIILFA
jgi:hypothetical protein